jgi:signal transduction histidine kinase/ligand-binding sensor domain-containing protein
MENGLPQNTVHALAQTSDGFLWLATEAGLVRFDGYAFSVFDATSTPATPSNDIRCLLATHDGALWVGTSSGLGRMKDGVVTTFTTAKGLPGNEVRSLAEDARGFVLVTTENGQVGIRGEKITPVQFDKLESADAALNPVMSATLANGEHAQATTSTVTLMQGKRNMSWSVGHELPGSRVETFFFDREGSLWIGTNGGLVRFAADKLDKLPVTDPLSSESILSLLEDREGNLWVGTETGGLHILRDERFRNIGTREGLSSDNTTTVVEDSADTLWVGTSGSGLNALPRIANGPTKARTYTVSDGLLSDVVLSLATAPNGDIWVGTPDGLNLIRHGKVDSFTSADGLPDDFVRSLLVDTDGSLWVGTRRGLTHWINAPAGRHMETFTHATGLGSDLVGAMARDSRGSLWVATLAGLSRLEGGKTTNYTTANGLSSDVITALLPRSEGALLIGTQDRGWNLWDGEKFSFPKESRLNVTSIHAILDDQGNHLWFATGNGIARCDCTMTADCTHWIEFGPADGLRSRETAINSHPSAWRSHDGRLWFATSKGLLEADPAHFPVNMIPPPVAVERFAVDDVDQPLHPTDLLKIPAGHGHFAFDYAGLSFTAPQKVRYRYMLEGFDHEWTDAGARRTAYYTNIPPGRYTFRVQAANNDGLWNTKGAALQFELRPHFYQTLWFYILLTAAAAGMVVLLLKRRLLRAEREFSAVLGERNRIAREIHDTLAQGYVGISVQLELLSELLRHNKVDAAQKQLDATRGHVREGLADARQSIWALRSQDSGEKTLPVTLRRITEVADGNGIEASFSVYGAYRPLPPGTEREFLRVAQEAIHNVKRHAGAKHLFVQMEYGQAGVALEVRDDGRGFASNEDSASAPGHYGMTGMRERAATVGGSLEVTSVPGEGTTVRLRAPTPKEPKE